MATVVTTPIQAAPSIIAVASTFVPSPTPVGILIQDNMGTGRVTQYRVELMRIALSPATTVTTPIMVQNTGASTTIARMQIFQPTATQHVVLSGPASLVLQQIVFKSPDSAPYVAVSHTPNNAVALTAALNMGTIVAFKGGNGDALVNGNPNTQFSGVYAENAFGFNITGPCAIQMFGLNRFVSSSGNQALRARATSSNPGVVAFQLQSSAALEIGGRPASTGVELDGLHYFQFDGVLQINGTVLTGISISNGSRVKISAASTDAATNQITYNNFATTDTLANMRLVSPPHFSDSYFSTIYQ
jgi:hypothetical protein